MQAGADFLPKRRSKRTRKSKNKNKRAVARLVKPLGIESKYYDTMSHGTTAYNITTNPASTDSNLSPRDMDCFNAMRNTADPDGRVGRQITMQSIQLRGCVRFPQTSTAGTVTAMIVRLALLVDHQPNSGAVEPIWNTIFESLAWDGADNVIRTIPNELAVFQFRALRNSKRFTILWDEVITYRYDDAYVTTTAAGVATVIKTNGSAYAFHVMRDLKDMVTEYHTNADLGDIGDIITNAVVLYGICSPLSTGNVNPTIDYVARLRYRG